MLLVVEDSSVLLKAKCRCASGAGVCGKMWIGHYNESTYSTCCCV